MKYFLFTLWCAFFFCGEAYASDTIFFSPNIPLKGNTLLKYHNNVLTIANDKQTRFWQFKQGEGIPSLYFELTEQMQKVIYLKNFGNDSALEKIKYALRVNHIYQPICKVHTTYVNEQNELYVLVSGQVAQPIPLRNPEVDFKISYFFAVLKIGHNKITEYYPIDDVVINDDYYVYDMGNFYKTSGGFVFTVGRVELKNKGNYFLGQWKINEQHRLKFESFLPCELSETHEKTGAGYNLMNFIQTGDYTAILIHNEIFNTTDGSIITFPVPNKPLLQLHNLHKGQHFDISFSLCDMQVTKEYIDILYRLHNNFHFVRIHSVSKQVVKQQELKTVTIDNLQRVPFFYEGEILLLKKESNYFVKYRQE